MNKGSGGKNDLICDGFEHRTFYKSFDNCFVTNGFKIGFQGLVNNSIPNNLKSAQEMPNLVSDHIQKELKAGRFAGPFPSPPFEKF